jgi:hypothetical protein
MAADRGDMERNVHHPQAQQVRESGGTARLEETLNKAVRALFDAEIPHLVAGGYAAQEHGCLRHTDNVDLIVLDIARAFAALSERGFRPHRSSETIVIDPDTAFEVRLHAGGSVPGAASGA